MQAKAMNRSGWLAGLLARLGGRTRPAWHTRPPTGEPDHGYAPTQLADGAGDTRLFAPWAQRGPDVGARPHDAGHGAAVLVRLLALDATMAALGAHDLRVLAGYFDVVEVGAGQCIIGQDEQGDYLLVLLQGQVAEERVQPSGVRVPLGELRAGELLGDLSMLDGALRLAACHALTPVQLAVFTQGQLARLTAEQPALAAALLTWLGKRLSLRLRQVSVRASVLLARLPVRPAAPAPAATPIPESR